MRYDNTLHGKFLDRPNRFIAKALVDGREEAVHVKNTGRCRELLLPGAEIILQTSSNPSRKTKYDLVAVYKDRLGWVNIDSQAPNQAVAEWLKKQDYSLIRPEYKYGGSRLDFYMERGGERYLMEVKGCTLEIGGVGYFPDAPTERGVKHIGELVKAAGEGYHCFLAFVIQMEGVEEVRPNIATHPQFGEALAQAKRAGVEILPLMCRVTEDSLMIWRQGVEMKI